jgi:hypothetical protein
VRRQSPRGNPQTVWCPENLALDDLPIPRRIAEGVLLLGSFVFEQMATDARYRDTGRVPLKTVYLRLIVGRHHLDEIRDTAKRIGYVDRDPSYRAGFNAQTYGILEPYASAPLVQRELRDAGLCRNLRAWREQRRQKIWDCVRRDETPVAGEVVEHLWRHLQRVRFDGEIDFDEDFHPAHQIAVDQLRHGDFRITVDDFGRIHTNLTNFKSELRANLSVDGQKLVNVDIGESQSLFIGLAMSSVRTDEGKNRNRGHEDRREAQPGNAHHMLDSNMLDKPTSPDWHLNRSCLPNDVNLYLRLCEGRGLYQKVADELGTTRDQAKRKVLAAFFDTPSHRNRVHDVLDSLFPSMMALMGQLKRDDYRRLAHFAQRTESGFMFGRVLPRLMTERPELFVATIHDSVLTVAENGEYVRQVMLDEFTKLGVRPIVRVEIC